MNRLDEIIFNIKLDRETLFVQYNIIKHILSVASEVNDKELEQLSTNKLAELERAIKYQKINSRNTIYKFGGNR